MENVVIRPSRPGDASYVSFLHMVFYERVYGFKGIFEYYLMAPMAEFLISPGGSCMWVATDAGKIVGSIAISRESESSAKLRWFLIDEKYQGKGLGQRLMDTAMHFCREQGYEHVFLWTIQMLDAARHLYKKYGFKITEEKPDTEWTGEPMIEERWDLYI